jgi:SAM-dependent methyltransferase/CRP-like cAMP-binding protein
MDLREDIRRRWDDAAAWFQRHEAADPNRNDLLFPRLLDTLTASLGTLSGKRILDAGCGDGRFANDLASRGAQVVGVDFSATIDAALRSSLRENPRFIKSDLVELRSIFTEARQFDAIVCNLVLQGAILITKILQEFSRLLKGHGTLILVVHDTEAVLPRSPWFARWEPRADLTEPDGGTSFLVRIAPDAKPVYYFHRPIETYRKALADAALDLATDEPLPAAAAFLKATPRLQALTNTRLFRLFLARPAIQATEADWQEVPVSQVTGIPGHGGAVLALVAARRPAASAAIRGFRKFDPVVLEGDPGGDLHVVSRGNALPYSSPENLREMLASRGPTERVDTLLATKGELVRYILCPGQLIGEFEVLSPRPFVANVLAGTPFELVHTRRSREETVCQIVRVRAGTIEDCCNDRSFRAQFQRIIYESFDHKLATLVHLISLADRGTVTQLLYLLWLSFKRWLPVTAYSLADGTRHPPEGNAAELVFPRDVNVPADRQGEITGIAVHNQFLEFMLGGREPSESVKILQGQGRKTHKYLERKFDIVEAAPSSRIKTWRVTINQESSLPQIWQILHGEEARTT